MAKKTRKSDDGDGARGSDAFALMKLIARVEGKSFDPESGNVVDRQWILDTYQQCRAAVIGKEPPRPVHLTVDEAAADAPDSISADAAASPSAPPAA